MPNNLPEPNTRKETFLASAAGMEVETPTPITREEMYLDAIAKGGGVSPDDAYTKAQTDALLDGKVDKETGKVLSTNDFTDAYKMAVDGAAPQATTYTKNETNALLAEKSDLVDGKIPAAQLPSYVDDVREYASTSAFPETGESGKIYISTDTNKTYRWGGSAYVEISESLALGETSSTAYPGNKGKANADAIAAIKDGTNIDSFADVETALAKKLNTADVDAALSDTSTNPVQNKVLTGQIGGLVDRGAKNHINYTLTTIKNINTAGTWNGNIYSINNVTYTVNDDMTITVSGTATGNASLILKRFDPQELIGYAGYILLGCPTGGSDETYRLEIQRAGSPWTRYVINYGEGVQIPDVGDSFAYQTQCFLMLSNGATVSNLTFKPMICSMEDYEASPEFVPYAPSNRELYEMILALQNGG